MARASLLSQGWRGKGRQIPGLHWLAGLAYLLNSVLEERTRRMAAEAQQLSCPLRARAYNKTKLVLTQTRTGTHTQCK